MNVITLNEKINCKALNKTVVDSVRPKIVVDSDAAVLDAQGNLLALYLENQFTQKNVIDEILSLPYQHSDRLSGIGSDSLIFGFAPRDYIKKHPCRATPFNRKHQKEYFYLHKLGKKAETILKEHFPDALEKHISNSSPVLSSWKIPETSFSSGIINKSNQLIYHTDNGNMSGCLSAMYTFRRDCDEGFLYLPEYEMLIKNRHGSLLWFDGANILHGVTPFKKKSAKSFRCTIVFYVLDKMQKCCCDQKAEIDLHNLKLSEKFVGKDKPNNQIG